MFANVLKKFFTGGGEYENKGATQVMEGHMLKDFKRIACRADVVLTDAIGAVALMVILFTGLHLPLVL